MNRPGQSIPPASPSRHLAVLDGLRGIAALAVMCMHCLTDTPLGPFPRRAYLAVDFFFVLSGYVVARAYERRLSDGLGILGFARIRLSRLYPLILLAVLLEFALQVPPHLRASPPWIDADWNFVVSFVSCALVLPFSLLGGKGNVMLFPIDPPVWSLMFEFAANFAYAAIAPLLPTGLLAGLVLLGAAGVCQTGWHYHSLDVGFWTGTVGGGWPRVGFSFFGGVLLCRLATEERIARLPKMPAWALAVALVAVLCVPPEFAGWPFEIAAVLVVFPAILILGLPDRVSPRARRWWLLAGALSYPVYILHKPIEERLWPIVSGLSPFRGAHGAGLLVPLAVEMALIIAGSYAAFRWFDVPVRDWLRRRTVRRRSSIDGPAPDDMASRSMPSTPRPAEAASLRRARFWSVELLLLMIAIAATYLVSYHANPSTPTATNPGWSEWFDQGEYYKAARDLAQFHLRPSFFWYGYPLLGAATARWLPLNPFLVPNLLMVCFMVACFYAACRSLVTRLEAWILAYASFAFDPQLWHLSLIIPWNSIVVYFAVFTCAWLLLFRTPSDRAFLLATLIIGVAAACRPPDVPALLLIYYCGLMRGGRLRGQGWRLAAPILACGLAAAVQLEINHVEYHGAAAANLQSASEVGFNWSHLWLKFYQWLVDPAVLTGNSTLKTDLTPAGVTVGAIDRLPYLLLFLPGLVVMSRRQPWAVAGLGAALAYSALLYLGFDATNYAPHHWTYMGLHYVWWFAPWAGLAVWLTLTRAWRVLRPVSFLLLLTAPALALSALAVHRTVLAEVPVSAANAEGKLGGATLARDGAVAILTVPIRANAPVYALRVLGAPAVPFIPGIAGSSEHLAVMRGGHTLALFHDWYPVGFSNDFYLSFINHPLSAADSEPLTIRIIGVSSAGVKPVAVEFLGMSWAPGSNFQHWEDLFSGWPPSFRRAALDPRQFPTLLSAEESLFDGATGLGGLIGSEGGRWTLGSTTSFSLHLRGTSADVVMVADLDPFLFGPHLDHQSFSVSFASVPLGEFSATRRFTTPITIPRPLWNRAAASGGAVALDFHWHNATAPKDLGFNQDTNHLAMVFRSLSFRLAGSAPAGP